MSFLVENQLQLGFAEFREARKSGGITCNSFATECSARSRETGANTEI
jgi:hypothetical protein